MSVAMTTLTATGKAGKVLDVSEKVFGVPYNEGLVHEVVTLLLGNLRADTSMQKNRSMRRGGGVKPWRQKGLGRARAGSIRSPLWRGGGITFGGQQANHQRKINKKAQRAATRVVLSELLRSERIKLVKQLAVEQPRTKEGKGLLDKLGVSGKVLIVLQAFDEQLYLAIRNIPGVEILLVNELDALSLVAFDQVLLDETALKSIEEWLQ